MTVLRVIGWLLIAAALILLGRDLFGWYSTGHWETSSAGKVWYSLAPGSLNLLQAVIERHTQELSRVSQTAQPAS